MHEYSLPPEYVARSEAREGKKHTVDSLEPGETALLVVDMQRYFMEEPYAGAAPVAQEIVPNVNWLARKLRSAGGRVVWLQMNAPASPDDWRVLRERYSPQAEEARWSALQSNADGFELWPDLDVRDGDWNVVKTRYSAFIDGSSTLDQWLRDGGVTTLLIAGVATNVCCESTARDAMMLDYRVAMVSDACAAATTAEHAASLNNFYLFFGDVQTTAQLIELIG